MARFYKQRGQYDSFSDYKKKQSKEFSFDKELDTLLDTFTKNSPVVAQSTKALSVWEEIAPPHFYKHTTGIAFRGTKLVITLDNPVFITDLSAMREFYTQAFNEKLGGEHVSSIQFFVAKPGGRSTSVSGIKKDQLSKKEEKEEETPRAPLSELEYKQLEAAVSTVENVELREALLKATVADLEWKKGVEQLKSPKNRN